MDDALLIAALTITVLLEKLVPGRWLPHITGAGFVIAGICMMIRASGD